MSKNATDQTQPARPCCGPGGEESVVPATELKKGIRERYGRIAVAASGSPGSGPAPAGVAACGCRQDDSLETVSLLMNERYTSVDERVVEAADLGLGCGTPLAFADMEEGMRVLDLGSGAGIDVFLAAQKVGPAGKAIGLDMTDEMLALARRNREALGIDNAEFLKGEIEDMPVESGSIDRIISNCVINLVPDKARAFAEMHRVLRPGGKFTVSDVVTIGRIPDELRGDPRLWCACVSGAMEKEEYLGVVRGAGFTDLVVAKEKPYPMPAGTPFRILSITLTARKGDR